jgi:competence protein ComEC
MRKLIFFLFIAVFIFIRNLAFSEEGCLKIHFIDVGEGDSILIETPNEKTILIDAGNLISGFKVAGYLKKHNVKNLDYLIFTHPDVDHIGGAFFVLQMLNVNNIYDNGQDLIEGNKCPDIYRWYNKLVRKNKNYKTLKSKGNLSFDGVVLKVLWPPAQRTFSDSNAASLAIMLEYGKFRCLLTGDLTAPGEDRFLKQRVSLRADVLKIGHHGASDANSKEFLKNVSPTIAIISVDSENIRGYPDIEVLDRLKAEGIRLYRTDIDGDIILSIYQNKDNEPQIHINTNKK